MLACSMKLKNWLELKGMNQSQFAEQIGVHRSTVYRYLSGDITPLFPEMVTAIDEATEGAVSALDWMGR